MASTRSRPDEPLVVILGSTGTGKSELAVELASRFEGEVINADAMQLYQGLPIITNKIPVSERRSVPHHLIDHIPLDQPTWAVDDFKREATRTIREIRSRGKLPIVVGGTHYYTNSLLFEDIFVGSEKEEPASAFPILSEPTEVIAAKLREVDPVMADRWHPNDRRKISRSLEIYLKYGRPASEIYAEQRQRKEDAEKKKQNQKTSAAPVEEDGEEGGVDNGPWQSLLFWVHSDPEVLRERLDQRVDKMVEAGLLDETAQMFEHVKQAEAEGREVDFTRGIWQSIGFKEMAPYLRLRALTADIAENPDNDDTAAAKLRASGLEDVKTSTRRYAKSQTRWINTKVVPLLREQPRAMDHLFLLDSTDVSLWGERVAKPAVSIACQFLDGLDLPEPASLSQKARDILDCAGAPAPQDQRTPCQRTCELCKVTSVTEEQWQKHVNSRRHKALLRRTRGRALVPVDGPAEEDGGSERQNGRNPASSPEVELGPIDFPSPG